MDYFTIGKDTLGDNARIPIIKAGKAVQVFDMMATEMVRTIQENNAKGKNTVFIVPVGPVGQYPIFVDMVNSLSLDLHDVWFINMDEYLSDDKRYIDKNHRLSFRGFMQRTVYEKIRKDLVMEERQRIFPDPDECTTIAKTIGHLGGVDVCFGGLGITGHVAFNEPEKVSVEEFTRRETRVLAISCETRTINAVGDLNGAIDAMPHWCVTVGMKEILESRKIRLYCFRDWHRAVVRQAAYGEKSACFPITLLQDHPDVTITITENVAEAAY